MKKLFVLLAALLAAGCTSTTSETTTTAEIQPCEVTSEASNDYVDTYSSASTTKITLDDDGVTEALTALSDVDSDLASLAETQADGYEEPANATTVQIMSVNPDGSVGLSTIHAWMVNVEDKTVEVELTDGQNAQNLMNIGDRGSILAKVDDTYYLLHLNTINDEILEYSDEAYEAGAFNSAYSGASNALCEYHITFEVLSVEQYAVLMLQ